MLSVENIGVNNIKKKGYTKQIVLLEMIPCKNIKDQKLLDTYKLSGEMLFSLITNYALCPETTGIEDKILSASNYHLPPYYITRIYFFPCSLKNKEECAPSEIIRHLSVSFATVRKAFDYTNRSHPISTTTDFDGQVEFDLRSAKSTWFRLRRNRVFDSDYDFFNSKMIIEYDDYYQYSTDFRQRDEVQTYCDKSWILNLTNDLCYGYLVIHYVASGETLEINRSYPKVFESLGEVGGAAEIILLVFGLIYCFYNKIKLDHYVETKLLRGVSLDKMTEYLKKEELGKRSNPEKNEKEKLKLHRGVVYPQEGVSVKEESIGADIEQIDLTSGKRELDYPPKDFRKKARFGRETLGKNATMYQTKHKNHKEEKKEVKELIEEFIDSSQDGIELYRKLGIVNILEAVFFKKRDRLLLPIVFLNMKKKEKIKEKEKEEKIKEIVKKKEDDDDDPEPKTPEEAYQQLLNDKPDNEVSAAIKSFLVENLPENFKRISTLNLKKYRRSPLQRQRKRATSVPKQFKLGSPRKGSEEVKISNVSDVMHQIKGSKPSLKDLLRTKPEEKSENKVSKKIRHFNPKVLKRQKASSRKLQRSVNQI